MLLLVCAETAAAQDWFVDAASGDDANTGITWGAAFKTVQKALTKVTQALPEIWVQEGTYPVAAIGSARTSTYDIPKYTELRGGFDGTEVVLGDRGTDLFDNTVLSGDIGGDGGTSTTDDAYHVMTISGTSEMTIDGFRIVHGNADGAGAGQSDGGGIFTVFHEGGITDCVFSNLIIEDCLAEDRGAGIFFERVGGDTFASRILIRDNICMDSSGLSGDGGALYMHECGPDLYWYNTHFDDNEAIYGGGVFNNKANGSVFFQNCVWNDNEAWAGGGLYTNVLAATTLAHCTMAYNKAITPAGNSRKGGSAVFNQVNNGGALNIGSSVLYHNVYTQLQTVGRPLLTAGTIGGKKVFIFVTYSCAELDFVPVLPGGPPPPGWFGAGSIFADPVFTNGTARDFTLQLTSPCIDAADDRNLLLDLADLDGDGDTGPGGEFTPLDQNENPREVDVATVPDTGFIGGNVAAITDMGAFEVQ